MFRTTVTVLSVLMLMAAGSIFADDPQFYFEDFDAGLPDEWTITDNSSADGGSWDLNNVCGRSSDYLDNDFVVADSGCYHSRIFDTTLTSPAIDCTGRYGVEFTFSTRFKSGLFDAAIIEVSTNGGESWVGAGIWVTDVSGNVAISHSTGGFDDQPDVRVRFKYTTFGARGKQWWAIDNFAATTDDWSGEQLGLTPAVSSKGSQPGESVGYVLTLFNDSKADGTVTITYSGSDWLVSGPASLEVKKWESESVFVKVRIPTDPNAADENQLVVQASLFSHTTTATLMTHREVSWGNTEPTMLGTMDHALVTDGTYIYKVGGNDGTDGTDLLERYDPVDDSWVELANAPMTLDLSVSAAYVDGRIYVFAGSVDGLATPDSMTRTFMYYDIALDQWSLEPVPVAGDGTWGANLVEEGGLLYKVGGGVTVGSRNPGLHVYDPEYDYWTELSFMGSPREFSCAYGYNGKIYVVGGRDHTGASAVTEIYDIATDDWYEDTQDLPEGRYGGGCPQLFNGDILLYVGGATTDVTVSNTVYVRDLLAKGVGWTGSFVDLGVGTFRTAGIGIGSQLVAVNGAVDVSLTDGKSDLDGDYSITNLVQSYGGWEREYICHIDDVYYEDSEFNPANDCEACDVGISLVEWTSLDAVSCDDGLFCTGVDTCTAGVCVSAGDPCDDDGLFCTGIESCDEDGDVCVATGDPCPAGTTCDEEADDCITADDDDDDNDTGDDDDDTADDDDDDNDTGDDDDDDTADDDDDDDDTGDDDDDTGDDDDDDDDNDTGDDDDDDDDGCG